MTKPLSQYISLNRRYSRSVNLERDLENLDALEGYIPTERSLTALKRIINAIKSPDGNRAWTVTSVYGTGKSAFAHYLASLLADSKNKLRLKAIDIAKDTLGQESEEYQALITTIPPKGYIRAVATAQREPISHSVVRALSIGVETYWTPAQRNKIPAVAKLTDLETEITTGGTINSRDIPKIVRELAQASQTGIFIIIDELGKSLEYAAYNQGAEDLYLLQQLSELPKNNAHPVYILGILHQAFADYSQRLAAVQRNEWAKIQGRFEDIPFTESASSMMRLMGQAIDKTQAEPFQCAIHNTAGDWFNALKNAIQGEELTLEIVEEIYPLHPVTALVLPTLCQRYDQNDRSLFTFLTSSEPYGLRNFLDEISINNEPFPTLKLDRVYDYFIEAAGMSLAFRPHLQRWVEIQDLITDSKRLETDSLRVLKTIGILNLITTTGANRATRKLVTLALCDSPSENKQRDYWSSIIDQLLNQGIITHRRQVDELRIWQGSDFNVDSELSKVIQQERGSLVELLTVLRPLNPLIAQRHSYQTGTLRYFERRYLDRTQTLDKLQLESKEGKKQKLESIADFNATLSQVCDQVYYQNPILWNELINRRELTSQGTKARRELITAMIEHSEEKMLGLSGYGPEVSMYYSLLGETGIHRQVSEDEISELETGEITNYWGIYLPEPSSGIYSFWQAVEDFCLNAYDKLSPLDRLYHKLAQPPYGIKEGAIPVLIAAVILHQIDNVGVYQDGTFIHTLGAEHFELLIKDPSRFAVKYFEVVGLRSEVFKELESILRHPNLKKAGKLRNATLLTVVTPLYQFVRKLPAYTKQTRRLSKEALGVLKALQETVEPDELIFTQLPIACNLSPIGTEAADDRTIAKTLRTKLVQSLREINTAYEKLLTDCQGLLYDAFGVRSNETQLREDLRVRAKYLAGQCVERNLKSFVQAAIDEDKSDTEWLEALVMVIGDKPPESWTDEDVTAFEIKLSDVARRFKNLEALQKEVAAKGEGFEARRITVTRPDGEETHRMVWVDNSKEAQVDKIVEEILGKLPKDEQLKQAILAKLTEKILNSDSTEGVTRLMEQSSPRKGKSKKNQSQKISG